MTNKKQITSALILIFLISFISAVTIYAGESYELELEKPYEYYSIVGNSTEVDITLTQDGNIVTITPNQYSQTDSYEIIFFDKEKETITIYQSSGGGTTTRWKTEYVNQTRVEYIDREVEVLGDIKNVETTTTITKIPSWIFGILLLLLVIIAYLFFFRKPDIDERGLEDNEQKIFNNNA